MSKWQTISLSEIAKPKTGPHKWTKSKFFSWTYCDRCGIVVTRNWLKIKQCNNCKKIFAICDG